ncbi:oxidation resistance protein 1 [Trichonephila clavipes]|nr:oxidation resistance protein 1 [Trichonephila clavipes]
MYTGETLLDLKEQAMFENAVYVTPKSATGATAGDSVDSFDEEVSDAFAATEAQASGQEAPSESRRERMLKRLSYPMESITSFSRILTSSPKSFVDFSGSLFSGGRGSEEEEIKEQEEDQQQQEEAADTGVGYQNLVEEKPEIFEALDKLLSKQKEEVEGPPLYLCLRMGIPKERKPHPSPVLSYGKKRARSEYWFSILRSRVEDLYNFLQQWIPHLYGDVDDVDPDEAGFIPIDDSLPDEEEEEEEETEEDQGEEKEAPRSFLKLVEEHFGFKSISPGDWEVESLPEPDEIGNFVEEVVDIARQINSGVDNDDVQELLDSHHQERTIDELTEMHEQDEPLLDMEANVLSLFGRNRSCHGKRVTYKPVSRGRISDELQVVFLRVLGDSEDDQSHVVIYRRPPQPCIEPKKVTPKKNVVPHKKSKNCVYSKSKYEEQVGKIKNSFRKASSSRDHEVAYSGHGHALVAGIVAVRFQILMSLKTRRVEGVMRVEIKSTRTNNNPAPDLENTVCVVVPPIQAIKFLRVAKLFHEVSQYLVAAVAEWYSSRISLLEDETPAGQTLLYLRGRLLPIFNLSLAFNTHLNTKRRSMLRILLDACSREWKPPAKVMTMQVLSLGEMEKINYSELELPLPDLLSPSEILQEEHIKELYTLLPARAVGYPWTRIFSTSFDGFLLKTLYRKMAEFDCPVIIVMQDYENAIFGALLSEPLKQSDTFYGTGETFLFTFHPSFKVFKWTGSNDMYIKGSKESFSIGASEGHFGLWIDADLERGHSSECQTFNNDILASSTDFVIKTLEAWGFV